MKKYSTHTEYMQDRWINFLRRKGYIYYGFGKFIYWDNVLWTSKSDGNRLWVAYDYNSVSGNLFAHVSQASLAVSQKNLDALINIQNSKSEYKIVWRKDSYGEYIASLKKSKFQIYL
jgi:hypothetical protein